MKTFKEFLTEVSKQTLSNYINKATPEARQHDNAAADLEKKLRKKDGYLHNPGKKLQNHRRKMYNRTKGVNQAFDKINEDGPQTPDAKKPHEGSMRKFIGHRLENTNKTSGQIKKEFGEKYGKHNLHHHDRIVSDMVD